MREKWGNVVPGMNAFNFEPGNTGMPMLDHLSKAFDTYHLIDCVMHLTSSASTSKNGTFQSAIDYLNRSDIGEAELQGLNGFVQDNVYKKQDRRVIVSQAMKQRLHSTATHTYENSGVPTKAFTFFVFTDAVPDTSDDHIGQVFVTYTIRLESANPPNSLLGKAAAQTVSTYINGVSKFPQVQPPVNTAENTDEDQSVNIINGLGNINSATTDAVVSSAEFTGMSQNSTFTIASTAPVPGSGETKHVQFRTADGTPIPPGVITAFPAPPAADNINILAFGAVPQDGIVYDLFATVYRIAKPWFKSVPIIADVITIIEDGQNAILSADDPQELLPNATAFAIGEEITITLPDMDVNVLTDLAMSRLSFQATTIDESHHLSILALDASIVNEFGFEVVYHDVTIPEGPGIGPDVGEGYDFVISLIDQETTPLVPGDILQVSFVYMDINNPSEFIATSFTPKPSLNHGLKQIVEGQYDYYVVLPVEEGVNRRLGFTDPTGAWPKLIVGQSTYATFSFTVCRMGSSKRPTVDLPITAFTAVNKSPQKTFTLKRK